MTKRLILGAMLAALCARAAVAQTTVYPMHRADPAPKIPVQFYSSTTGQARSDIAYNTSGLTLACGSSDVGDDGSVAFTLEANTTPETWDAPTSAAHARLGLQDPTNAAANPTYIVDLPTAFINNSSARFISCWFRGVSGMLDRTFQLYLDFSTEAEMVAAIENGGPYDSDVTLIEGTDATDAIGSAARAAVRGEVDDATSTSIESSEFAGNDDHSLIGGLIMVFDPSPAAGNFRIITDNVGGVLTWAEPMTSVPDIGDAFLVLPGAQTGDSFARLGMPANGSIAADIADSKTQMFSGTADSGTTTSFTDAELAERYTADDALDGAYVLRDDGQRCNIDDYDADGGVVTFDCTFSGAWATQDYDIYPAGSLP